MSPPVSSHDGVAWRQKYGIFMKKTSRTVYIAAFALFLAAAGILCAVAFNEGSVYFLNVAEARQASQAELRQARLFGVVAPNGMERQASAVSFQLSDKDNDALVIPIDYFGPIPDTFKAGAEVIVEGAMQGNGRFAAKTLMTKCPSKYQKENRKI